MASQRPGVGTRMIVNQNGELDIWDLLRRGRGQDGAMDLLEDGYLTRPHVAATIDHVELYLFRSKKRNALGEAVPHHHVS
jgi:hypothetical protein